MKIHDLFTENKKHILNTYEDVEKYVASQFNIPTSNFKIDPATLVVDTNYDVKYFHTSIDYFPIKFGLVDANFIFNNSFIFDLSNGPTRVTGNYNIGKTKITSLIGCPSYVGGYFCCFDTEITSLEGCPEYVGDMFSCAGCSKLTSLAHLPKELRGPLYCKNIGITDPKEYRYGLYCKLEKKFLSEIEEIDEIINEYKGADNRKHWAKAINLLGKVKL